MADKTQKPCNPNNLSDAKPSLESLRAEVDRLDLEILERINRRAEIAKYIGAIKSESSLEVFSPQREHEILNRLMEKNAGPLSEDSVRAVFRELISGSRAMQKRLRVAYLGPEYSYSHLAAIHRFGQSIELIPVGTIATVFDEVQRGHVEFGMVPIENSTDGRVVDALNCLADSPVKMCGEVPLRIHHCLLGLCERGDVKRVYSKPQALSQCRNWLAMNLPAAELIPIASTSEAAKRASEEQGAAAVASEQAGVNNHLSLLAKNIEDNPDNITRFAVISDKPADPSGDDKTAILFSIEHSSGSLAGSLEVFSRHGLNLTWIESFPIPNARGRYLFFVEFQGHASDAAAQQALAELASNSKRLEVLGSYAQSEPVG